MSQRRKNPTANRISSENSGLRRLQNQNEQDPLDPRAARAPVLPVAEKSEPKPPLGVGSIMAESFSVLTGNVLKLILASSVPMAFFIVPLALLLANVSTISFQNPSANWPVMAIFTGTSLLAFCAAISLISAAVTKLTYNAKHLRPTSFRQTIGPALAATPSIGLLGIAVGALLLVAQVSMFALGYVTPLLSFVALPMFFVVYFWSIAAFALMPSAAVIENRGLRSLSRSMELTKGYRLAVLGTMILAGLCSVAIQLLFSFATFFLTIVVSLVSETLSALLSFVSSLAAFGVMIGFMCIVACLVYMRLREVKEGVGIDQIEAIFE